MDKMDQIKDIKNKWETDQTGFPNINLTKIRSADTAINIFAEIKKSIYELRDLLFEHLSDEETIVPPLLKANFKFEEVCEIVRRIFAESGPV